MPEGAVTRVLLVVEDPLARAGLASQLGPRPLLSLVARPPADVELWDFALNAEVLLKRLAERAGSDAHVLCLVNDQETAAEAITSGARGALLRTIDPGLLEAALIAVARGLSVTEPTFLRSRAATDRPPPPLAELLTPRESQVLQLLTQGLSNKAIAQRLEISEHTAKFHVNAILQKLGVERRTEAIVRAAQLGLVLL